MVVVFEVEPGPFGADVGEQMGPEAPEPRFVEEPWKPERGDPRQHTAVVAAVVDMELAWKNAWDGLPRCTSEAVVLPTCTETGCRGRDMDRRHSGAVAGAVAWERSLQPCVQAGVGNGDVGIGVKNPNADEPNPLKKRGGAPRLAPWWQRQHWW